MTSSSSPSPPSLALSVASTLGFVWAALMLLLSIAVAIPAAAQGAGATSMALPAALAVASGLGAHGVRRRRWPFLALGSSAAWVAFLVLVPLKVSVLGIALHIAITGLVVTNLRRFR